MKNLKFKKQQKGVALAVGMILLLIISIIGVTSMKSAILQGKMASGLKDRELADAAALSLLVQAEKYIYTLYKESNGVVIGAGSDYTIAPRSTESNYFRTNRDLLGGFDFTSGTPSVSINDKFGGLLSEEPQFIIEATEDVVTSSSGSSGTGSVVIGSGGGPEFDSSNGAASSSGGAGSSNVGSKLVTYRIVSKATGRSGHVISAFESVMSVKTR